eukprot:3303145-Alexandrium_andersonii.AAC.1
MPTKASACCVAKLCSSAERRAAMLPSVSRRRSLSAAQVHSHGGANSAAPCLRSPPRGGRAGRPRPSTAKL